MSTYSDVAADSPTAFIIPLTATARTVGLCSTPVSSRYRARIPFATLKWKQRAWRKLQKKKQQLTFQIPAAKFSESTVPSQCVLLLLRIEENSNELQE
jgi:hypothetical protein